MAVALLVTLAPLVGLTVVTARRPGTPPPTFDGYLARWSRAHDGYDPRAGRLLSAWLRAVHGVARPVAATGVQPDAVTAWTVWLGLLVVALADAGAGWAVAGAAVIVLSGLGDALDGAVAVLTDRASAWGYVLDSLADRLNDALYLVAVWVVGGPALLAVACGVTSGLLEYVRARAGNAGADPVAVVTVGERPQRVICCALGLVSAGLVPSRATELTTISLSVLLVLSAVGLAQLVADVRAQLRPTQRHRDGRRG